MPARPPPAAIVQTFDRLGFEDRLRAEGFLASAQMLTLDPRLQPVVTFTSWYRSPEENAALPNSEPDSQHQVGLALDWVGAGGGAIAALLDDFTVIEPQTPEGNWHAQAFPKSRRIVSELLSDQAPPPEGASSPRTQRGVGRAACTQPGLPAVFGSGAWRS